MGGAGDQRTAGGGVLQPQGLTPAAIGGAGILPASRVPVPPSEEENGPRIGGGIFVALRLLPSAARPGRLRGLPSPAQSKPDGKGRGEKAKLAFG